MSMFSELLVRFLKDEGFTHVLKAEGPSRGEPLKRLESFYQDLENPGLFEPLAKIQSQNIRDSRMNYTLYRIK